MSRFSPRILYERLLTQSKYQPQTQNTHGSKHFSIFSRFFLLRPEAQKKKAIKKENAEGFRRLRAATWAPPQTPPPFEKGGRKLKKRQRNFEDGK